MIYDITPLTMLDYPNQLSAIIWFAGCDMRCPYCYNPDIVNSTGNINEEALYKFLNTRQKLLDGVVLSGGEATGYKNIIELCYNIKELGYLIKLDTSGSRPEVVKELLENKLLDFVALDYKSPQSTFEKLTSSGLYKEFSTTLDLLINQTDIDFEVRTTVHPGLLGVEDINCIINDLIKRGYNKKYYIQKAITETKMLGEVGNYDSWIDTTKLNLGDLELEIRQR
jgi:pyruvate formate lyase activating enzyme